MSISFPSQPALNAVFTSGSSSWIWDGSKWNIYTNNSPSFVNITATGTISAQGGFVGGLSGNATTSTTALTAGKLTNAVSINGITFDGSTPITVTTPGTGISISGTTIANTGSLSFSGTSGTLTTSTANGSLNFASQNGITIAVSGNTITISDPQDLRPTATPTFSSVTANSVIVGGLNIKSLAVAMSAALS